jgi:nucleotide-binding universal stress UspA family protein
MSAVVVGYVPSPEGRAALAKGIEEARFRAVRLVVVNAVGGATSVDERYLQPEAVADLRAELDALDVPAELRQASDGMDVAEEIDRIAGEVSAELVVIGLRRRTPVGKLILGSAASRILLTVHQPVMAVKAPAAAQPPAGTG